MDICAIRRLKLESNLSPVATSVKIGHLKWNSLKASALRSHSLFHSTPNVQQSYIRVQITNVQRITATYWPTMNGPKQIHTPDPSVSSSTRTFERGYERNAT